MKTEEGVPPKEEFIILNGRSLVKDNETVETNIDIIKTNELTILHGLGKMNKEKQKQHELRKYTVHLYAPYNTILDRYDKMKQSSHE